MTLEKDQLLIINSNLRKKTIQYLSSIKCDTFLKLEKLTLSELAFLKCPMNMIMEIKKFKEDVLMAYSENDQEKLDTLFSLNNDLSAVNLDLITLDTPLSELNLSGRTRNALGRHKDKFVKDIINYSYADFVNISGMGRTSADEIYYIVKHLKEKNSIESVTLISDIDNEKEEQFVCFSKYYPIEEMTLNVRGYNALMKNNLFFLGDVLNCDLYSIENLGNGTIDLINNEIELVHNDFLTFEFVNEYDASLKGKMIGSFNGFEKTIYAKCVNMCFEEAYNDFLINYNEIKKFDSKEKVSTYLFFKRIVSSNYVDVNSILDNAFKMYKIDERALDIYFKRGEGYTLEELGIKYSVQRERIRQIEASVIKKIKKIYEEENISLYYNSNKIIRNNFVSDVLNEHYNKVFLKRLNELDEYTVLKVEDGNIFIDNTLYLSIEECFKNIVNAIHNNDYVSYDVILQLPYDDDIKRYFMAKNKIEVFGDMCSFKSNKRQKVALYLSKNIIVDLSSQNIGFVIDDLSKNYGLDVESERSLIALFNDVSYSLGNSKYTSLDNNPVIPEYVLEAIFEEIEDKKFVKSDVIYNKYKNSISNLLSPTHLYGYLKRFYPDKYNYGGTNLVISMPGTETSNAARVLNYIKGKNAPVEKDELIINLGLDGLALNVIDQQSEEIIKYGKTKYYLKSSLYILESDLLFVQNYLNKISYFTPGDIRTYFVIKKSEILNYNYISTDEEMISFILNIKNDLFNSFVFNKEYNRFDKKKNFDDSVLTDDFDFEI